MSGTNGFGKVGAEASPGTRSSSTALYEAAPPPSGWLHLQIWKLKTLLEEKNAEIERLKTLLTEKDAENGILSEKLNRMEAELVSEVEASGDLFVEMMEVKEETARKLMEKDAEIKELRKTVRRVEIQNSLWDTGSKSPAMIMTQNQRKVYVVMSEDEKVLHLFPDVLKIIIQNEPRFKDCISWRSLMHILTACRLVCKSWKAAVDSAMQQDSSQLDLCPRFKEYKGRKFKLDLTPCPFQLSYENFDRIRRSTELEVMERYQKIDPIYNPIPTRNLMIEPDFALGSSEKWNEYCEMVTGYLQVLGKQIWYLTVAFREADDNDSTASVVYKCLSDWFSLLPNLKSLWLYLPVSRTWKVNEVSFPKFEKLIAFEGFLESPLTYKILECNRHVSKLGLCPDYDVPVSSHNFMELDLPHLKTLCCYFNKLENWKMFENVTWKLEELTVEFHDDVELTTAEFFDGLAKFGSTLKSLTFNSVDWSDPKEVRVNLPQLEYLHFQSEDWEQDELQEILVQLKSLEALSVKLLVTDKDLIYEDIPTESERRDFLEYVNNFRDNMDWMKLPKLKSVKVTVKFNGREIGEQEIFVVTRTGGLSSVRFDVPKIRDGDIPNIDEMMTRILFTVFPFRSLCTES